MTAIDPNALFELRLEGDGLRFTLDNLNAQYHTRGELYIELRDIEQYDTLALWLEVEDVQSIVDTLTFWLEQQKLLGNVK